jgi:hypothetical protein
LKHRLLLRFNLKGRAVGENDAFFKVNARPLAIMASVPRPDTCQLLRK